jgi:hypothetical protein
MEIEKKKKLNQNRMLAPTSNSHFLTVQHNLLQGSLIHILRNQRGKGGQPSTQCRKLP